MYCKSLMTKQYVINLTSNTTPKKYLSKKEVHNKLLNKRNLRKTSHISKELEKFFLIRRFTIGLFLSIRMFFQPREVKLLMRSFMTWRKLLKSLKEGNWQRLINFQCCTFFGLNFECFQLIFCCWCCNLSGFYRKIFF